MGVAPIFFCFASLTRLRRGEFFRINVHLTNLIEATLAAMGYELVDVERAPAGLLRVTIDRAQAAIVIEDCEKVSHQLTRVFEVENVNYARLEISSPGLDRPLRTLADFTRFAGQQAKVTLRLPMDGQKTFAGVVRAPTGESGRERIGLVLQGQESPALLEFTLPEMDRARLVPVLDFKGNRNKGNKQ